MKKLNQVLVIDGDPIGTFISQSLYEDAHASQPVCFLTGTWEALDYLRLHYPMGAAPQSRGQSLLLLGHTLKGPEFLRELALCKQIDCSRLYIVVLTHMYRNRDFEEISSHTVHAAYPQPLHSALIDKIIADCIKALSKPLTTPVS